MRADRLLSLVMLLQKNNQMTADSLAAELEVSTRTIYRDIDVLSSSGVPIYAEGGPGGGYALLDSYRTTLTGLNENEARLLFMMTLPGPIRDLTVGRELKGTILKLTQSLSETHLDLAEAVQQRLILDSSRWFQPAEPLVFLTTLQDAIWQNQMIDLIYKRRNGAINRRQSRPYGLAAKAGHWYLIAEHGNKFVVYRVSRIVSVHVLSSTFARVEFFDLVKFWQNWVHEYESSLSKYPVTLRVGPQAASILSLVLGEHVQLILDDAKPDHDQVRTIQYTFERRDEARMFALGMGRGIEVIDPIELREEILQMAKDVVQAYGRVG
ncbi:MAG: YafY family protein [Chloroflexota bacterium]